MYLEYSVKSIGFFIVFPALHNVAIYRSTFQTLQVLLHTSTKSDTDLENVQLRINIWPISLSILSTKSIHKPLQEHLRATARMLSAFVSNEWLPARLLWRGSHSGLLFEDIYGHFKSRSIYSSVCAATYSISKKKEKHHAAFVLGKVRTLRADNGEKNIQEVHHSGVLLFRCC